MTSPQLHLCVPFSGTCPSFPVHCSTHWGRIQRVKETKQLQGSDTDRSMGEGKAVQGSRARNSLPASPRQVGVHLSPGKQGSIPGTWGNKHHHFQHPPLPASVPSFQTDSSSTWPGSPLEPGQGPLSQLCLSPFLVLPQPPHCQGRMRNRKGLGSGQEQKPGIFLAQIQAQPQRSPWEGS